MAPRCFLLPLGFTLLLSAAGCVSSDPLGAERKAGDLEVVKSGAPRQWSVGASVSSSSATGWLGDFDDPDLQRLVRLALERNHDLKAAANRVTQARAQAKAAGAELWPQVGVDFGGRRNQSASGQRFVGSGVRSNRFEMGADISWELDLWGRLRDQRGASAAGAEAAQEDLYAAQLSLAGTTVKSALTLAETRAQIQLSEENIATRRINLGVLEKQLDRGIDTEQVALDVSLARADLARAEATLASRKREADEARRGLELLLGAYPAGKEHGVADLPGMRKNVPAGLPSEMLLRRPDLRAMERRLESALRSESGAKKAFLPSFSLTGSGGLSSDELSLLLQREAVVWSLAGSVAQQVFQGGRLRANAEEARARYDEILSTYSGRALQAFKEVEGALAAEIYLKEQESALTTAAAEAERAVELAISRYSRGLSDALTVLDSRQRAFDARSALLAVQALRLRNRVDLHLALGGSF
ncbi:efflux transporter outer membrane subunit [Verrucomicrobium spinosum]|uniref:efflux transporter outer membrane subunit n=2 Tax=Verrucomicrobium spinosum TaxID=2736 RepID=UPI0006A71999|nr:efflux transporter outer membrane subunit [Verrucomicrobium spinosum]